MTLGHRRQSHEDGQYSTCSDTSRRFSDSERSDQSHRSNSTAPTEYDYMCSKPGRHRSEDYGIAQGADTYYGECSADLKHDPRASVETYASTVPSLEDFEDVDPEIQPPIYQSGGYLSDALPTTPADFAELFPSTRRLIVRHDDSTSDGNMNLRITTQVKSSRGRIRDMTLFHLRMYDLKERQFSLRRYDRDSGREVCHTMRKHQKPTAEKRPGFQRSLSNALASLRSVSDTKMATRSSLDRNDSGYGLAFHPQQQESVGRTTSAGDLSGSHDRTATNTTKLEFSNYAQVDVKRRASTSGKRYEFEYWGRSYFWKQASHKEGEKSDTSYHLFRSGNDHSLAHIVPEFLGTSQQHEEQARGGWVPPCSMWITDEGVREMQNDVSDVAVASGLVALVDGCIKTHFQSKQTRQLMHPLAKFSQDKEFVGPKRLLTEVLGRPSTSHGTPTHRQTPLRHTSYDR